MKSSRESVKMVKSNSSDCIDKVYSDASVDSESFVRMPQSALVSCLFMRHGLSWLYVMICVILIMIVLTFLFADLRWLIAALMALFIVVPACMAFLYINYALHPLVAFNVLPHSIFVDVDAGIIEVDVYVPVSGQLDSVQSDAGCPDDSEICKGYTAAVREKFDLVGIGPLRTVSGGYTLDVRNGKGRGFLWIPESGPIDYEALEIVINKAGSLEIS